MSQHRVPQTRDLLRAAIRASDCDLTSRGYNQHDLARLPICALAANLAAQYLLSRGLNARRQTHIIPGDATHSFVIIEDENGIVVGDRTWQQFLPRHIDHRDLPEVLIGNLPEVKQATRNHGIPEALLALWDPSTRIDERALRNSDLRAERAADMAMHLGLWDQFANQNR